MCGKRRGESPVSNERKEGVRADAARRLRTETCRWFEFNPIRLDSKARKENDAVHRFQGPGSLCRARLRSAQRKPPAA